MNVSDDKKAMEKARQAVRDIEAVKRFLNDEPSVLAEYVQAQTVLAHILSLRGERDQATSLRAQILTDVESLAQHRDHNHASWARALYFLEAGSEDDFVSDFERRVREDLPVYAYLAPICASVHFRRNKLEQARRACSAMRGTGDISEQIRLYIRMAASGRGDRQALAESFISGAMSRAKTDSPSRGHLVFDWTVLRMLGENEAASDTVRAFRSSASPNPDKVAKLADYMDGSNLNEQHLLENCSDMQVYLAYANYIIAIRKLSEGDRQGAKKHFNQVLAARDYQNYFHWWSRAFLTRVCEPKWLPWIEVKQPCKTVQ